MRRSVTAGLLFALFAASAVGLRSRRRPVGSQLDHLVMTRTASDATLRLSLDGTEITGELGATVSPSSSWALVPLVVGNSSESNRPWRGTIHRLAIHSRALTPAEIATNHGAGADP